MTIDNALEEFVNEVVELTELLVDQPGHSDPDGAFFAADVSGGKVRIPLYEEDRKAIRAAGYKLAAGAQTVPIRALMGANRRLDWIIGPDGSEHEIHRRNTRPYKPLHGQPIGTPRTEATDGTAALKPQLEIVPAPHALASLYAKIARVMGEVRRVEKGNAVKNASGADMYRIASGDDLLDMLRPIMAAHNVICIPAIVSIEKKLVEKNMQYYGKFEFTIADGETGVSFNRHWESEVYELPWSDKGINKLSRIAERYFLTNLFQLSTGDTTDDADLSQNNEGQAGKKKPARLKYPPQQNTPPSTPAGKEPAQPNGGAPAMVIAKIKTDKGVQAAWQSSNEATNTINAMWREGELQDDMDDAEKVKRVIERLQSHQVAPPTGGKGEARPWKVGERTTFAEAAQVDGLNERDWLAALNVEKLDEWQGTFSEARATLGAYVSAQIGGAK